MTTKTIPRGWSLDAREDESQSWLVLTGPNGEACAFAAERGSVRAQVLQDFMIARSAVHGNKAPENETLPCALPPSVSLSETDVVIAQSAATARAEMCAICDEEFIGHRYGARGHDWRPKPVPHAPKASE